MHLLLLVGCLVNRDLYEERKGDLSHTQDTAACADPQDLTTWYADRDGDGRGDPGDTTEACVAPDEFVGVAGDCDDTQALAWEGAEEIPYDGIDNDCTGGDANDLDGDGDAALAAGGGDCDDADPTRYSGATESWENGFTDNDCDGDLEAAVLEFGSEVIEGESAGGQFGRRLAAVGDLDGDGVSDFAVGAVYLSDYADYGGALYLGDGRAQSAAELGRVYSGTPYDYLGIVAAGPDADDDEVPDVLVAATGREDGAGAAWLLSGVDLADIEEAEISGLAVSRIDGSEAGSYMGSYSSALGDLDGDGVEEWGMTAPFATAGSLSQAGVVGVWSSAGLVAGGTLDEADDLVEGWYESAQYGVFIQAASDVDDDGYDDFMVGVGSGELAVVLPGGVADLSAESDPFFRLEAETGSETCDPRMIGDVDGDGAADLGCLFEYHTVLVYTSLTGTPRRTTGDPTATVDAGEGSFVFDLLDLGDLDGDGRAETLVPAKWNEEVGSSTAGIIEGSAMTFGADLALADARLQTVSTRPAAGYGYRATTVGDTTGDGQQDFVLSTGGDSEGGVDAGGAVVVTVPH